MRKWLIGIWAITTIILVIMVVRLNGRMWDAEKKIANLTAVQTVYLMPDDAVVECYKEKEWKRLKDE